MRRSLAVVAAAALVLGAVGSASAQEAAAETAASSVSERGVADKLKKHVEKRKLKNQQKKLENKIERAELELQMRQQRMAQLRAQTEIRVVGPDTVQVGDKVFKGRRAVARAQRAAKRPRKQAGKLQREIDDYTAQLGERGGPPRYGDVGGQPVRRSGLRGQLQEVQDQLQELKSGPPRRRPVATPATTPAETGPEPQTASPPSPASRPPARPLPPTPGPRPPAKPLPPTPGG